VSYGVGSRTDLFRNAIDSSRSALASIVTSAVLVIILFPHAIVSVNDITAFCVLHCRFCNSRLWSSSSIFSLKLPIVFLVFCCQPLVVLRRKPTRLAMQIPHSPAAPDQPRCVNADLASASGARALIAGQWAIGTSSHQSSQFKLRQLLLLRIQPPEVPSGSGDLTKGCFGFSGSTAGFAVSSGSSPDSTTSWPSASP